VVGAILSALEDIDVPLIETDVYDMTVLSPLISIVIEAARLGENYRAAKNLRHFFNSGTPVTDYDVDGMINDLGVFSFDILRQLNASLPTLVHSDIVSTPLPIINPIPSHCRQAMTITDWRRVGWADNILPDVQRTEINIYPSVNFDLEGHPKSILQLFNSPSREFDWFIAQNAFWYSIGISTVVDTKRQNVQVCYHVFVEDYYAWYINSGTQTVDAIMARLDQAGLGVNYPISGKSSIRCFDTDLSSPIITG